MTELLPVGTIVQVTECGPDARTYVGKVVGYDMWRSKYEIGLRFMGWSEWRFLDGGSWAFRNWVEPYSNEGGSRCSGPL